MNPLILVVCGLMGYCPDPRPLPKPRPTPRDPLSGILGGLVGGYLTYIALGIEGTPTGMEFVAMLGAAFAFGRVFQEVASWIFPGKDNR